MAEAMCLLAEHIYTYQVQPGFRFRIPP